MDKVLSTLVLLVFVAGLQSCCKRNKTYTLKGTLHTHCNGQPVALSELKLLAFGDEELRLTTNTDTNGNFQFTYQHICGWGHKRPLSVMMYGDCCTEDLHFPPNQDLDVGTIYAYDSGTVRLFLKADPMTADDTLWYVVKTGYSPYSYMAGPFKDTVFDVTVARVNAYGDNHRATVYWSVNWDSTQWKHVDLGGCGVVDSVTIELP